MKKYFLTSLVVLLVFLILITILLSQYTLSTSEKIIITFVISLIVGYLFHLKMHTEDTVKKLLKAKEISKVGFWSLEFSDNTLYWSDEIYEIFEISPQKFKPSYQKFLDTIHPEDRDIVNDSFTNSLQTKQDYAITHRLLMNDGTIKWVKEECQTDFDKNGNPLVSIGIVTDTTKEVQYLHAIEKSENILNTVINSTDDIIFFKDKDFNYLGCNKEHERFVGKTKKEIIGHNDFELFDNKEMASSMRETDIMMLEKNEISSHYKWVTYPNGDKFYLIIKIIPFHYNKTDIGILGITRDITELHLAQEKIKAQSYIDELTKLHNRKAYNERMEELLSLKKRNKTSFSMIMYDIDNFKSVNDTYGHRVGDTVLIQMSALVKSYIRESDYLFRIGGEEFIILLTETDVKDALTVATKICKSVENDLKNIINTPITISLGLSEANESDTEDTIFKRVDTLLYKSKNDGKNRVSF